jgi:hypothetical protein
MGTKDCCTVVRLVGEGVRRLLRLEIAALEDREGRDGVEGHDGVEGRLVTENEGRTSFKTNWPS